MPFESRFLDFSGSPPILLPLRLAAGWKGIVDPSTGFATDLNLENPQTDYDRACAAAHEANATLKFRGVDVLVLYTESDHHVWIEEMAIIMCGRWIPESRLIESASWIDPVNWICSESNPILLNSSVDASKGAVENEDFLRTTLPAGRYLVETALVTNGEFGGIAHRFRLLH